MMPRPQHTSAADLRGLRDVRDDDRDGLVDLIGSVFDEYPGCVLDLDDLDADLLAPTAALERRGGDWWVLPAVDVGLDRIGLAATIGCGQVVEQVVELKRLYVAADARRRGLGGALVRHVEAVAHERGARQVELWSDTRFLDAHRLYAGLGYQMTGQTRDLHDPSNTTEYRFVRDL